MQRIGSRAQVMHGNAIMTGGGLRKKDLKYNKHGKIVSKKVSAIAKKEKRLQKAGYLTKKGQFGVIMKGGYGEKYIVINKKKEFTFLRKNAEETSNWVRNLNNRQNIKVNNKDLVENIDENSNALGLDWVKIKILKGQFRDYEGFIRRKYLQKLDESATPSASRTPRAGKRYIVKNKKKKFTILRKNHEETSNWVRNSNNTQNIQVNNGELVENIDEYTNELGNEWVKIKILNGQFRDYEGFIRKIYLQKLDESATPSASRTPAASASASRKSAASRTPGASVSTSRTPGASVSVTDNKIKVLTYNVSWGCMSIPPTEQNQTSRILARKCKNLYDPSSHNGNICLKNVAKILNGTDDSWNDSARRLINDHMFDFIAIQESMNSTIIHDNMEIIYKNQYTEITHGQINQEGITINLTIFLNNNKYDLVETSTGDYVQYVGSLFRNAGRPIQIIYVLHKSTNNYYIFINLHNHHGISRIHLQKELEFHLRRFISLFRKTIKKYSIIISGDFNDHKKRDNYFNGLYLDGKSYESIEPPKTCCVGKHSIRSSNGEDTYVGDYTLSNYGMNRITEVFIPLSIPWYNSHLHPASDHLPCVTIMKR